MDKNQDRDFDFERDKELINSRRQANEEYRQNKAHQKLNSRIIKNMETVMIGCLEEIEDGFGYLWGHDKGGPRTDVEREFYELWQEVRGALLDRANHKISQTEKEIQKYNVTNRKHTYKFKLRNDR